MTEPVHQTAPLPGPACHDTVPALDPGAGQGGIVGGKEVDHERSVLPRL